MAARFAHLKSSIRNYYAHSLRTHGAVPQGADWNGDFSQRLRCQQLVKILPDRGAVSLNDVGCGYGALVRFLKTNVATRWSYRGYDLSEEMIEAARKMHRRIRRARFQSIDDTSQISTSD